LSVTPADSLRLWQASSGSDNVVTSDNEPGMHADQWGAAASATSGVRSNATLDSGRCMYPRGDVVIIISIDLDFTYVIFHACHD
jgi:hypothetical protein